MERHYFALRRTVCPPDNEGSLRAQVIRHYGDDDDGDVDVSTAGRRRTESHALRLPASRQGGSCLKYATTAPQGVATLVDAPCLKASWPRLASSFPRAEARTSEAASVRKTKREKEREIEGVKGRKRTDGGSAETTMDQTEEEAEV